MTRRLTGDWPRPSGHVGSGPVPIYATGNHDVRTEFHRQLLGRDDTDEPILQVHRLGGLRIIVLDSTIPGAGHGRLTEAHLAELTAELATAAPPGPSSSCTTPRCRRRRRC